MNWQKIKFKCTSCGDESWMEVNLDTYVVEKIDLVCDDCTREIDEDEWEDDEVDETQRLMIEDFD